MKMLALYFGTDEVTFTVTSANPNANPNSRTYASFTDAALDVVEARIYQGIHTRSADLNGRHLGKSVARWVFKHALRPLKYGSDDEDNDAAAVTALPFLVHHLPAVSIDRLPPGVRLRFTCESGRTYSIERASTVTGP